MSIPKRPFLLLENFDLKLEAKPEYLMDILNSHVDVVWTNDFNLDESSYCDKIEAIMVLHGKPSVTRQLLEKLPKLKIVAVFGAGYNSVDTKLVKSFGIRVSNTPNVLNNACANMAVLLMLAAARNLLRDAEFAKAETTTRFLMNTVAMGVNDMTLGIVGMGKIGYSVAKRARAFNLRIRYHNRNQRCSSEEEAVGAIFHRDLNEMLPHCDYVMVTASLTAQTRRMIGADQFRLMKKSAVFINVSRGATVDHDALTDALTSGRIRSAALDVTEPEPLPRDHPLLGMDNVIITPHVSSATVDARRKMCQLAIDNVLAATAGAVQLPSEIPEY